MILMILMQKFLSTGGNETDVGESWIRGVEHKREQNSDIYAICITNIRFKQSKCNSELKFPKETQETGSTLNLYNIYGFLMHKVILVHT